MTPEWANEAPIVEPSQTLDETAIEGAAFCVSPADATDVDVSFSDGDLTMSLADEGQATEGITVDEDYENVDRVERSKKSHVNLSSKHKHIVT